MKAILFTQEDTDGFNALQERIHLHMISKIGVDGFKYSADCWAILSESIIHEDKLCLPIEENGLRGSFILEVLSEEEIAAIVDVTLAEPE
jgi:hypothetical protein